MMRAFLLIVAACLCMLAVSRMAFLLLFRRPVCARIGQTGLTDMQRAHDRDMYRLARMDGLPTPEDVPYRSVLARVAYEIEGVEHRGDVYLITPKGQRPEASPVVWYDPADPSRVSGLGLGSAASLLLAGGAVAALAYDWPA